MRRDIHQNDISVKISFFIIDWTFAIYLLGAAKESPIITPLMEYVRQKRSDASGAQVGTKSFCLCLWILNKAKPWERKVVHKLLKNMLFHFCFIYSNCLTLFPLYLFFFIFILNFSFANL